MTDEIKKWHAAKSCGIGQGLVIEEETGRNVAVSYDIKDAELLAAAPDLLEALKWVASHYCSGGKSFGEIDIVRNAIEKATLAILI